jgi:hypothetical protein
MFKQKLLSMVLLAGMLLGQTAPPALAANICDQAQFVSDITVPDGASFAPGAAFTKTWRFMNAGTCLWTTSYKLVQSGGDAMNAPAPINLPVNVPAGQMLDISVNLTAPSSAGHYKSLWKFANTSGIQFGVGDSGTDAFWVDINVVATDAVIYDFVANAPYAKWKSGAGALPYPGTSGDSRGFAYPIDKPHLEDDSFDSLPGLLTVPQNKYNGYIQATYPEFQIQQGDKLQTLVSCEFGAINCYVTFRIDYLLPSGAQKQLWSFKEAYDKRFYRANIDLSPLAGQKVRFVFMLLSTGLAANDRAIWGSPRIVRAGTVQPPAPPATLTPLPALTQTQTPIVPPPPTIAPSGCDRATFITDVNVPDGTSFAPGAAFSKTWRIKNSGSCTWTRDYKLMYYSGEQMSAPTSINMPLNVFPGETVDLTINMVAPNSPGQYRGFWIFANANGTLFGIGSNASNPFWVEINVAGTSPVNTGYDFTANACSAQWKSGAGSLPCPGTDGDSKGFVLIQNAPTLEDGSSGAPGLVTFPQNKYNGYIQGYYPTFTVQPGDRFQATVGCAHGSNCYVTYRLEYMNPNGYIGTFWTWREQNDRKIHNADIDLSPLAGRSVRFILTILATGYATNDRVIWGSPRIFRQGGTLPTITAVPPTNTQTPSTSDWLTYTNSTYGFQFKYPPQSQVINQSPESLLMNLPITPGTNLGEKYLETSVTQNAGTCQSPLATPNHGTSETVTINGISFLKQADGDAGAGNFHDWVAYSASRENTCVSMGFVLHYLNADNSEPPQPEFDRAAESALFLQMMSTFTFLTTPPTSTSTPTPATATPGPPINNWLTYSNSTYGFQFNYPPGAQISNQQNNFARIDLPFQSGTNLSEKYMEAMVVENAPSCQSSLQTPHPPETVTINGISFLKQTAEDAGVGHLRQWVAYSTLRGNVCVTLTFILHSLNPGNFATPPPVFDFAGESSVFTQIMSTFAWLAPSPTPTQDPSTFAQTLVTALNARDFNTARSSMGQSFGFSFWQSQGFSSTPDEAIQQLQNYLGATPLTPNTSQDLYALLAGLNPYAIMGLDPTTSQGLFVTGWGLDGKGEAILYATRRPDGSLYWDSVLIAPSGFIPDADPIITHEAFCADTRIAPLIDQLKGSMNQSNGDMFSYLVGPVYGLDVRLWAYQPAVNFNAYTARSVFTSTNSYTWGTGPSLITDVGSFKDVIQPKLLDVLNAPNMETYCDSLDKVYPLANPWPYPNVRFYNLYKPGTPGIVLDFRTWLIGFEYINDQPYLHSMVTIVWEP